ncbi:MAG: hypothetical protein KGO92_03655 [Bacteroidota bacterium]|nr:hypothetical protein [Bacteroidota bacterium]
MKLTVRFRSYRLAMGLLLFCLSSCQSVRLISSYDEITDKAVTAFQEKVSRFFIKIDRNLGTENAAYQKNKSFYEDAGVDLNTLQIRTDAIDNNQIVQKQVAALQQMMQDLEKLHQLGFNSHEELIPLRNGFNSAFTALTKLQLALKRGGK